MGISFYPTRQSYISFLVFFFSLCLTTLAHEHHNEDLPSGQAVTSDPIDNTLKIHILLQSTTFLILFPLGLVLGLIRSPLHAPIQILATLLAIAGYILGHSHHSPRQFASPHAHGQFAPILMISVFTQVALGLFLKLHLEKRWPKITFFRKMVLFCHAVIAAFIPILSWTQVLLGVIVYQGFCRADHTGQCFAHFIMGSAFIAYGIVLVILLLVGQEWLARRGKSQEFYDSIVISAWGLVNALTEHHWGHSWNNTDFQHTTMGVVWLAAGLVGIWLSRDAKGRPKRNLIPALVIFITGWAMSGHSQHLMLSTMMHGVFGWTLMAAGLARIIEIAFVLRDKSKLDSSQRNDREYEPEEKVHSWQYLPPFLLIASGLLFMGSTEEQMQVLSDMGTMHVPYVLLLFSAGFFIYFFALILIRIYSTAPRTIARHEAAHKPLPTTNGTSDRNYQDEQQQLRQVEEFELEGLMTDDEDDDVLHNKERGIINR